MVKGMALNRIPGYLEAIAKAKAKQNRARENAWKNLPVEIFGFKVRIMTVQDYVILDHFGSPFINRQEPQLCDIAWLFWVLSPNCSIWNNGHGWRKPWLSFFRTLETFLYTRRVERKLRRHPDKFESVVKEIFDYVENVFMDSPPAVQKQNSSGISYLTHWFDLLQGENHLTMDEIWRMSLPQLFQRTLSIYQRKGIKVPVFNVVEDKVKQWVQQGIAQRRFTFDDLAEGKVKFDQN